MSNTTKGKNPMVKRSTPMFLKQLEAATEQARASKKEQAVKRTVETVTKRTTATKMSKSDLARINITLPANIRDNMIAYDSQFFKNLADLEVEIYDPWRGGQRLRDGTAKQWRLSDVATMSKGSSAIHLHESPSAVETWANGKNAIQFRDAMFNCIPDGPIKDMERKFMSKWGDYRHLGWSDWADKLWDMYAPRTFAPDESLWSMAISIVKDELLTSGGLFEAEPVVPMETMEAAMALVTENKNSGLPWNTSKWAEDPVVVDFYKDMAGAMLDGEFPHEFFAYRYGISIEQAKAFTGALLFARRQPNGGVDMGTSALNAEGKPSVKMRPVEGVVKADAIAAKILAEPVLNRMREVKTFAGYAGADNIGRLLWDSMADHYHALEGDFSSFDASCQRGMMSTAFQVLKAINLPHFSRYFTMLEEWYLTMWVWTPNGILTGEHGLFSGCAWTSVLGSISNRLATVYTLLAMGFNPLDEESVMHYAFGDDIALFTNTPIDINLFEEIMLDVGMDCNRTKQSQSSFDARNVSFLGYRHYFNMPPSEDLTQPYVGIYPIMRCQFFFRERDMDLDIVAKSGLTVETWDIVRYIAKLEPLRNHPNRMEALATLISFGCPLKHVDIPTGQLPQELRVGRRSRAVLLSDYWMMGILPKVETPMPVKNDAQRLLEAIQEQQPQIVAEAQKVTTERPKLKVKTVSQTVTVSTKKVITIPVGFTYPTTTIPGNALSITQRMMTGYNGPGF